MCLFCMAFRKGIGLERLTSIASVFWRLQLLIRCKGCFQFFETLFSVSLSGTLSSGNGVSSIVSGTLLAFESPCQ